MPFDPNDADTKAAIAEAIKEANTAVEAKNKELLDDLKKVKNDLRAKSEINPADLEKAEAEADRLKGELTVAQKAAKDATTAREKLEKQLEGESGFTRKLLVENNLKDTLIRGGVKDEDFLDALVTKFSQGAQVIVEGDVRKAMVGDKELGTIVSEYLATDAGKKFVSAPHNSGGGATGGKGGTSGKSVTNETFQAMGPKERAAHFADGGVIAD